MPTKGNLPSYPDYVAPALAAFRARGGSASIEEMEEGVAEIMDLSDELLALPHGDGPRTQFRYELAWVRTYLKKVGALQNSERGIWSLTDAGERMTDEEARGVFAKVRAAAHGLRKLKAGPISPAQPALTDSEAEAAELG